MKRVPVLPVLSLIAVIVSGCLSLCSRSRSRTHHVSPCGYRPDPEYAGGTLVDCRGLGLKAVPAPDWIPLNTTSLLLQDNSIDCLHKDSFPTAGQLRFLSLARNYLNTTHAKAFRGILTLEVLDLQGNRLCLNDSSSMEPCFSQLNSLQDLRLGNNQNGGCWNCQYQPQLLTGLHSLHTLSLDTFGGNLSFSGIFKHTDTLHSLTLSGGVTAIRNESFQGFESVQLKKLIISGVGQLNLIETGAFRYVTSLDKLTIDGSVQGIKNILESLAPFAHKNITLTQLAIVGTRSMAGYGWRSKENFEDSSVVSNHAARFLSQICVKHFDFRDNYVFIVENGVFVNQLWFKCLVSLDVSENPILGEKFLLVRFAGFESLQSFLFDNRRYSLFDTYDQLPVISNEELNITNESVDFSGHSAHWQHPLNLIRGKGINSTAASKQELSRPNFTSTYQNIPADRKTCFGGKSSFSLKVYFPPEIVHFSFRGFGQNTIRFDANIFIDGGSKLKEFYLSDSGVSGMTNHVVGLEVVEKLDLSQNDGSQITACFLSSFPAVSHLNMSRMQLFLALASTDSSRQLFYSLPLVETLDLSHNGLYTLPPGLFSQNNLLKVLSLAGNRFKFLPARGEHLPSLHVLDIRGNSLSQLSPLDALSLEQRAHKSPSFSLKLSGNVFACGCANIRFMQWLQVTRMILDNHRNYSCIMEDGRITMTTDMKDVAALWRQCYGQTAFLVSLVLVSLLLLCVCLVGVYMKFQTQIVATVFQYFSKNFTLKTGRDYPTGVYIGYADRDTDFACGTLRQFVEGELGLTTYLRHRDQMPGADMAGTTVTAINSCWRILLVISPAYLADHWSFLAIKSAMYAVSSLNPGRLVLVFLEDSDMTHNIPSYVLTAVREESIVHVPELSALTAQERLQLGNALLH